MPPSTTKPPAPTATATATTKPPVQRAAPPRRSRSRSPPPSPPAVRALPQALRSMPGLPARIARLLETKDDGADVEFEVGGKVFDAHKLVLAARSPVFREDFFGADKEEATCYVRICDMHPDTFEALLHYVYTNSLPAAAVLATGGEAAVVLAQDLLRAADRYDLRGLKSLAESELCWHILGVGTVLPMLALAERHQCWKLKKKCLGFIASGTNARAVMAATDDVDHLVRSCPSLVKELVEILEAEDKEATPSRRPLMGRADAFYLALGYILAFLIFPLGMWALMHWGYLEQN